MMSKVLILFMNVDMKNINSRLLAMLLNVNVMPHVKSSLFFVDEMLKKKHFVHKSSARF